MEKKGATFESEDSLELLARRCSSSATSRSIFLYRSTLLRDKGSARLNCVEAEILDVEEGGRELLQTDVVGDFRQGAFALLLEPGIRHYKFGVARVRRLLCR